MLLESAAHGSGQQRLGSMRHGCAMPSGDAESQRLGQEFQSGRRESNPRSQLGKTSQADGADDGEPQRQVGEPTNPGEPPRTDPDAP
jgi:hypothetical protein